MGHVTEMALALAVQVERHRAEAPSCCSGIFALLDSFNISFKSCK